MIIVHRAKTGCRQYIFENYREVAEFFIKPCYRGEDLLISEFNDDGSYKRKFKTNTNDIVVGIGVQLDLFRNVTH